MEVVLFDHVGICSKCPWPSRLTGENVANECAKSYVKVEFTSAKETRLGTNLTQLSGNSSNCL